LGAIISQYKSRVTKGINLLRRTPGEPVWQRNYYDRIIRNTRELLASRNTSLRILFNGRRIVKKERSVTYEISAVQGDPAGRPYSSDTEEVIPRFGG